MLTQIHIDMDGPIVNLCQGALAIYTDDPRKIEPVREWDGIADAIERTLAIEIAGRAGIPVGEPDNIICEVTLWKTIRNEGARFWAGLPKAEFADAIVSACKASGAEVSFLTSLDGAPGWQSGRASVFAEGAIVAGKLAWVAEHYPDIPVTFVHGGSKVRHAAAGHFLIDDMLANVTGWSRAARGHAFLWPSTYGEHGRDPNEADVETISYMLHERRHGCGS